MTRTQWLNPPRTGTRHYETREEWLLRAIDMLGWYFDEIDRPLPDITIRKEWPDVTPESRKILLGMCSSKWIEDYDTPDEIIYTKIFIAPDIAEDLQVLEVLVHELAHAAVGVGCLHNEPFPTIAAQLGLAGAMTSTHANTKLRIRLLNVSNTLGPYPEN